MQAIMNFTGQQQQQQQQREEGDHQSSSLDLNLTLRKKASLWYRRSLRGIYDQYTHSSSSLPRGYKPRQSRSNSLVDHNPQRTTIVLNKQDHETFGFEIQTTPLRLRNNCSVEMCTFVCRVHEDSVAESSGLTTGDIIASINGISTEDSSHQRILDLIRESTNILKMETVYGNVMKRLELEKRMNLLKLSLREKLMELQELTVRENHLMRGNLDDDASVQSSESQSSSTRHFSSESSCRSVSTNNDSVFDDVSSPSPCSSTSITDDGCFFSRDFSESSARFSSSSNSLHQNLSRSSSSSLAGSSSSLSSSWEITRISSLFGTLPRKGRRASVRKHILKLFPGLQRSVEEEEMGTDTQ